MIIAAHQPHFLPWLGYVDKIRAADAFILVDHIQFERQNFQNRTRINTRHGPQWISVPVHRGSREDRLIDKRIDNKPDGRITWGERIYRTLAHAYGKAAHFDDHRRPIRDLLTGRWERLVDLNLALLEYLLDQLAIDTPLLRSSRLRGICGARSEMIVSLCRAVGADVYLSGTGGSRCYLDVSRFERLGLRIEWQAFEHPVYPQGSAVFRPRMSALDLLFHCGPRSARILRAGAHDRELPAAHAGIRTGVAS